MVLGGCAVLFVLLIIVFVVTASAGSNHPTAQVPDVAAAHYSRLPWPDTKQYVNTAAAAMPVHHVPPTTACWPGVWVGPSPAVSHVDHRADLGQPLVQRRHPSGIAGRVTPHGVIR